MEMKSKPSPISRIQREEEESWISEEDLNTDGSTDDDGCKGEAKAFILQTHCYSIQSSTPTSNNTGHITRNSHLRLERRISPAIMGNINLAPDILQTPLSSTEPVVQDKPHLTETTRRMSEMGLKDPKELTPDLVSNIDVVPQHSSDVEEQEDIMLWRPKRGSIKLPHIDLDPATPRHRQKVTG